MVGTGERGRGKRVTGYVVNTFSTSHLLPKIEKSVGAVCYTKNTD